MVLLSPARLAIAILLVLGLVGALGIRSEAGLPTSVLERILHLDAGMTAPQDRLLAPLSRDVQGHMQLLGTDDLGRNLALRLAVALGTSLAIASTGALVALGIGTGIGTAAGLAGGRGDAWLMRATEVTAAIPAVLLTMVLVAVLRSWGDGVVFAAMGLLFWQPVARLVRARVLRLRNEPYFEAARAIGAPPWHRIRRHLLPGLWPTVLTAGALLLPRLILLESLLAYLGVSTSPHSFGRIIAGVTATLTPLSPSWWPVIVPCGILALFVLCLNVVLDDLDRRRSV